MTDQNDAFLRNQNAAVQGRTKAQNRANVLQLKMIGQSHPTGLTPNLLKLFEPRPPLEYKPPPEKRKCPPYMGMAQYANLFAEPGDPEYAPPVKEAETPSQRRARIHELRLEKGAAKAAEELEKYDPQSNQSATEDPYKTLFVARLSYETSESRLKREFETYGAIKRVKMVYDKETNKPKGYAFIEYAHTRDMKAAYKQADGRKIDGRRVLVDVERGRTVPNWRPRRLGGGLGTTRVGGEDVNQRHSTREPPAGGPSRSEEPKIREDRDREKSRERGREREKEREKSRERSHERPRDRDHKEDRHHRDRDRTRDKERDRGRDRDRDRDRTRDRDRGKDRGREHDRERDHGRSRDRHRDRDRDYEAGETDHDRGHSRDRDYDYDHAEAKHDRGRHGERERGYDHAGADEERGWYEDDHEHKRSETEPDDKSYDHYGHHQGRGQYDNKDALGDNDRYNHMEEDDYSYDRDA
ncbi:U1 small nuclear ribonucleoprotein 70 kDa [Beta vulgaris subsp. vulgaris]|uniref:U1 small nuclear ribonucleoprotein 70 kDa n=1 Tax=Beta vulgaris subsp. vulgaris TaxID=3555 RepID=UPI0020376578|nr:U1 small nuclear ribonucleoprotein 70 kDa [Beta vulgaris subsp. vulgaris]